MTTYSALVAKSTEITTRQYEVRNKMVQAGTAKENIWEWDAHCAQELIEVNWERTAFIRENLIKRDVLGEVAISQLSTGEHVAHYFDEERVFKSDAVAKCYARYINWKLANSL